MIFLNIEDFVLNIPNIFCKTNGLKFQIVRYFILVNNMNQKIEMVPVEDLYFDPKNPRFSSIQFDKEDERAVIDLMIKEENLDDLAISIADQGFFPGEPLLVYRDGEKRIVAEGNRRLAAVKVLKQPELTTRRSFHEIAENALKQTNEVPCLIFSSRDETLEYLGFKHITGNKKWGALEKAIYLSQLRDFIRTQHGEDLDNQELHRLLARKIGSQGPTVGKTLTAYEIYLRGNKHNTEAVFFGLQGVDQSQVEFSLVYTALGYEHIYSYLGLSSSSDVDLENFNEERGRDLFRWLFKQDEFGQKAVSESRKLKELNKVLGSPEATSYFLKHNDLDSAYRLSAGPLEAFEGLIRTLRRDEKQLQILFKQMKEDSLKNNVPPSFTNSHAVEIEELGRALRNLADDIESFIRRSKG